MNDLSALKLNFVNLKKQLLEKSKDETRVLQAIGTENDLSGGLDGNGKPAEVKLPLFFTNDYFYKKYPFFINAYSVKNSSGFIANNFGYSRDLQFYDTKLVSDKPLNKFVKYQVEYVTQKNLDYSSILFKGRANEDVYKKETKKTWVGTQYGENQHKNFQQALIHAVQVLHHSFHELRHRSGLKVCSFFILNCSGSRKRGWFRRSLFRY